MNFDLIDKTMQEHGAKQENQRRNCGKRDEKNRKREIDTGSLLFGREALEMHFWKNIESLVKALKNQNTKRFFPRIFPNKSCRIVMKLIFHSIRKIFRTTRRIIFTKVMPEKRIFRNLIDSFRELSDVVKRLPCKTPRKGEK